jgi:tetratricopeptide (TPR) repeat protein
MESSANGSFRDQAVGLLKAGKINEAIELLSKAHKEDPEDSLVHTYLGVAYQQKNDKLHAIHHFEEALRFDESAKNYYNLAAMYESVHRIDEAVRQYKMSVEADPNYAKASDALKRLADQYASEHPKETT